MDGFARPVRMDVMSSRATETAFSIFSSASKRVSSITSAPWSGRCGSLEGSGDRSDGRADLLAVHRSRDVALRGHVEDDDRQPVVPAEADGGGVGDLQV